MSFYSTEPLSKTTQRAKQQRAEERTLNGISRVSQTQVDCHWQPNVIADWTKAYSNIRASCPSAPSSGDWLILTIPRLCTKFSFYPRKYLFGESPKDSIFYQSHPYSYDSKNTHTALNININKENTNLTQTLHALSRINAQYLVKWLL